MFLQDLFSKSKKTLVICIGVILQYFYSSIFKCLIYFIQYFLTGLLVLAKQIYSMDLVDFIRNLLKIKSISLGSLLKISTSSSNIPMKTSMFAFISNVQQKETIFFLCGMILSIIVTMLFFIFINKIILRYFNKTLPKYIENHRELKIQKNLLLLYACLNICYEFLNGSSLFVLCLLILFTYFRNGSLVMSKEIFYILIALGVFLLVGSYFLSPVITSFLIYILISSIVFVLMFFRSYEYISHIRNLYLKRNND